MTRASSARPVSAPPARRAAVRTSRRSGFGGTLLGLFIGIAVGLGLAAAVAYYVMKAGNPYQPAVAANTREAAKDPARSARADPAVADKPRFDFYKILPGGEEARAPARAGERPVPDKAAPERVSAPDKAIARLEERPSPAAPDTAASKARDVPAAADKPAGKAPESPPVPPKAGERFWLQAGSFSSEGDAENMKAQLALSGLEPTLQQATLPDKSVRFRVRLGPYANADEMNRVKADLAKRGVDVAVIR